MLARSSPPGGRFPYGSRPDGSSTRPLEPSFRDTSVACRGLSLNGQAPAAPARTVQLRSVHVLERLGQNPGPQERAEIERMLEKIETALDLLDETRPGPSTTDET